MYAIEFETELNDRFIEIEDFEKVANKHVRVILLVDDEPVYLKDNNRDFISELIENPLRPEESLFLSREEANER